MDSYVNEKKHNPDNSVDWTLQPFKKHKQCVANDSVTYSDAQPAYDKHRATCTEKVTRGDTGDLPGFDKLPKELIYRILEYLTPEELCQYVAPVCKKWKHFAHDPVLWKCVVLHGEKRSVKSSRRILEKCHQFLKSLTLCRFLKLKEFAGQLGICNFLNILRLTACEGVDATFLTLLTANAPLLEEVSFEASDVSDEAALKIPEWKDLHTINLSGTHLTEESFIHIVKKCTKLKSISVEINELSDEVVKILIEERKGTLQKLYLEGSHLSDDSCKTLAQCEHLDSLSILNAKQLSDISLNSIKSLSKLKFLRLTQGLSFSNKGLSSLFRETRSSQLLFLDLSECFGVNDGVVQAITRCGSKLEILRLDHCCFLSDAGMQAIVNSCRRLKVLSLVNSKLVKGHGLKAISRSVPHLTSLNLHMCDNVQEETVCELLNQKKDLSIFDPQGRQAVFGVVPSRWKTTAEVDVHKEYSLTMSCLEDMSCHGMGIALSYFAPLTRR